MNATSVLEQLVGVWDETTPVSDMAIMLSCCSKFGGRTVHINFDLGTLEVYDKEDDVTVEETYVIRATLQPLSLED